LVEWARHSTEENQKELIDTEEQIKLIFYTNKEGIFSKYENINCKKLEETKWKFPENEEDA